MGIEQAKVIDEKESKELKEGNIDRVEDSGVNTMADLTIFLRQQEKDALAAIRVQLDSLVTVTDTTISPDEKAAIIKEGEGLIRDTVESTLSGLTLTSIRVACSKLSDIVGFELEIDEQGLDQFGLSTRETARERHGTGFEGYQEEKVQDGDVEGTAESSLEAKRMSRLDTPPEEIEAVLAILSQHGEARYEAFGNQGPVLVILPELHYDADILGQSLDVLTEAKGHVAMLATEGVENLEFTQDMIGGKGTADRSTYDEQLRRRELSISSIAAEDILGEELYTLGVEDRGNIQYTIQAVQEMVKYAENDPELRQNALRLTSTMMADGIMTKEEMVTYSNQSADLLTEGFTETVMRYRNQIWLDNIQRGLLSQPEKLSSASNIVFLTCGAAHKTDLIERAKAYGFKGVLDYRPSVFDQPVDQSSLVSYAEKQMGKKVEEPQVPKERTEGELKQRENSIEALESTLTQKEYSAAFQKYAYNFLGSMGISTERINETIGSSSRNPNMVLFEALAEITTGRGPETETEEEEAARIISGVLAPLVKIARESGDTHFESIQATLEVKLGLKLNPLA